jgi:hypothetical protein
VLGAGFIERRAERRAEGLAERRAERHLGKRYSFPTNQATC